LGISRKPFYYTPKVNEKKIAIKNQILKIFEEIPIYGEQKVHQQLLEDGF
jgi:putative transposase